MGKLFEIRVDKWDATCYDIRMTTNTNGIANEHAWHFVASEDYEDNANIRDWKVEHVFAHIDDLIGELKGQHYDPQMIEIRYVPARDELMSTFYWVEYISVYDEIETVDVIGFAYIPRMASNAYIEKVFVDSYAR